MRRRGVHKKVSPSSDHCRLEVINGGEQIVELGTGLAPGEESQQLAEVALRVQPSTLYYIIDRDGEQIGAASSALDTTANSLVSEEYFVGDFGSPAKSPERTSARGQTRLTRGLHLIDLNADVARPTKPFSINATVQEDTS